MCRSLSDGRHKSIVAYLAANNLPSAAEALRAEIGLDEETFDAATAKKYETLLEKKWTSVVRLQKKVPGFASTQRCAAPLYLTRPTSLTASFLDYGPRVPEHLSADRNR